MPRPVNLLMIVFLGLLLGNIGKIDSYGALQDEQKPAAVQPSEIWVGVLDVDVMKLRLQLNLQIDAGGKATGELLSLDQTSTPLPITGVTRSRDQLAFTVPNLGLAYEGTIAGKEGAEIATGVLLQQGKKVELAFRRSKDAVVVSHTSTWRGSFLLVDNGTIFNFESLLITSIYLRSS